MSIDLILDRNTTNYHGQGETHKRVHLAEEVAKNPSAGKTGNNVEPKI